MAIITNFVIAQAVQIFEGSLSAKDHIFHQFDHIFKQIVKIELKSRPTCLYIRFLKMFKFPFGVFGTTV